MGRFLSFGRSPKPADTPGTPENLQLDDLLLFSEDSLPVSLLKHNPDNQGRAVKMFASVLQYMGVHGEILGAMQALELAQKLLHQGLKRVELRDELYMQLVKQTRGNPNAAARTKAWQLFYLTAATMPPSKDFMGLVSGAPRPGHRRPGLPRCLVHLCWRGCASLVAEMLRAVRPLRPLTARFPPLLLQSTCTRVPTTRRRLGRSGTWPPRPGTP